MPLIAADWMPFFWAAVPHYVSTPPSPKASLALVNALEDFLEISIPQGDLPDRAESWEKQVDQMASEDAEIGDYVKQLESNKDALDIPGPPVRVSLEK